MNCVGLQIFGCQNNDWRVVSRVGKKSGYAASWVVQL
jgi:hypothetical protein